VAYEVRFADDVQEHLWALTVSERSAALDAIERHLLYEPLVGNSQSKALAPESGRAVGVASWQASVFYEVAPGEPSLVRILAVGKKERNILRVAGREVRL